MKKQIILFCVILCSLQLWAIENNSKTKWQKRAEQHQEQAQDITWLTHEPIEFLMRRGGHFDNEPQRYEDMCSPDNIVNMAKAGVKWGRIFFYKGFGLEYEMPNIKKAIATADIMHKQGMKVSIYMAGTMFTETLYREVPQAVNWEQRDQNDQWVPYGLQTFRHYACPNEPAYRDYVKRILDIGINELHADEIAFDNIMLQTEPKSCRCPRCMKAFRDYLREEYPTKEAMMRRFGLPDPEWIKVNEWSSESQPAGIRELNDPVLQEWVRFRCMSLANHCNDLYEYVKSQNPNVVVLFNIKGVYSFNRYWTNAVYQPFFKDHIDLLAFDTGGYDAHIDENTGALISQIRSYKIARRLNTGCENSCRKPLEAVLHMAFGHQKQIPGAVGAPFGSGAFDAFTPELEFFREYNDRYYTLTDNVADVAVLRNWASMAYSINAAYEPATLMEQILIQHKVPFDLLFEEQLDRADQYKAIVLAGQECVSNEQVELLLNYVRNGGTLLITGNTAEYNGWREQRHTNPLLPARKEGKGKIVYIPEIIPGKKEKKSLDFMVDDPEPGATLRRGEKMSPPQWVLPSNHREIYQTLVSNIPDGLAIECDASLTTVMELLNRDKSHETLAHFINFKEQPESAFETTIQKQYDGKIKSVKCFTPDLDDPVNLEFVEKNGKITFTVPETRLYSMVVIEQ